MGIVIMHNVVSVDGFIADENDDVGPLHDWYFAGDTPITEGSEQGFDHSGSGSAFKVSNGFGRLCPGDVDVDRHDRDGPSSGAPFTT